MASKASKKTAAKTAVITQAIATEIQRIATEHGYSAAVLKDFALYVLNPPEPIPSPKPLTLPQLKDAVFKHFGVKDTTALKKSGTYKMATSGLGKLDLSKKPGWESIYRKVVGVLPNEENEQGYGCVNGINIFKYDLPWKAFGLDPQSATTEDVKTAYRKLSKIYHPDNSETGDASTFERLTLFYKSLTEKF